MRTSLPSRRTPAHILLICCALLLATGPAVRGQNDAAATSKSGAALPVAVVDFEIRGLKVAGDRAADDFATYLGETRPLSILPRRQVKKLPVSPDGPDPAAKAALVAATQARYAIVGRVFIAGGSMFAAVKIIDLETGEMYGKAVKSPADGKPEAQLRRLAEDVAAYLATLPGVAVAQKPASEKAPAVATEKPEHAILLPPTPAPTRAPTPKPPKPQAP